MNYKNNYFFYMFGFFFNLLNEYYFNKRYYFYYLCIKKNSEFDKNKLKYQVKGLYPQSFFSIKNNNTSKVSFDIKKLEPIKDKLDKYWYSNGEKDCYFFQSQYFKFYEKAFTKYTELDYFNITLKLFEEVMKNNNFQDRTFNENREIYIPVDIKFKFFKFEKK